MTSLSKADVKRLVKDWNSWRQLASDTAKSRRGTNNHDTAWRYESVASTYLCCINALEGAAGIPLDEQTR